ncbi:MAG TPA: lipid-binding SYLF domain-containing protein [Caulobacteraceae bacterium]|nr:lipid-binding SYLF domain-containing protein [Caulobacteraceae bacterium]
MKSTRRSAIVAALALASLPAFLAPAAHAASAAQLTADGKRALDNLYAVEPRARVFARHARAILVFPHIITGAFVFGGETGNGVLLQRGRPTGFYNISAASWGLQAGGKQFSYALFLMNDRALGYLHQSGGWAIGAGANIVVVDQAAAAAANSTTLSQDVYAFPFAQKGLMAGIDIHGSKITQYHPS